jgi:suppressor of tumorigenicity protein 13
MIDAKQVAELKEFIQLVTEKPALLHEAELDFFKQYIESLGGVVPSPVGDSEPLPPRPVVPTEPLSEADEERIGSLKSEAAEAVETGDRTRAIALYTEIFAKGGVSAMTLTKRADLLLKQSRPLAAIADCDFALELNPSSGKAYRIRGLAYRQLENFEAAHFDLAKAQSIDYDEETEQVKKFVDAEWNEIKPAPRQPAAVPSRQPAPTAGMPPGMGDLFSDPDLAAAMTNPRMMTALQQMMTNPAAIFEYQNDPEIGPILMKLMSKMGGQL